MEQRAGTGPELRAAGKAGASPIATGDLLVAKGETPELSSIGYSRRSEYPIVRQKIANSGNPIHRTAGRKNPVPAGISAG
jgi:hypothetical protein